MVEKVLLKISLLIMLGMGLFTLQVDETLATEVVKKYACYEITLSASREIPDPFDTYLLRIEVKDPRGNIRELDGFFDGDGNGGQKGKVWKARFSPDIEGLWTWKTIPGDLPDQELKGQSGSFLCVESNMKGGLGAIGRYFVDGSGNALYLQGNFLDFYQGLVSTHVFMSERIDDSMRQAILERQIARHGVNKINVYLANRGDYKGLSVTPWLRRGEKLDRNHMDLSHWKDYDKYIESITAHGLWLELWFFADDSGFGNWKQKDKNRLFRYAMARTSAYSTTSYVIALEWEEGWSRASVNESGLFLMGHNPWKRLLSVHHAPFDPPGNVFERLRVKLFAKGWVFSDQLWPGFIASQVGNEAGPDLVNKVAVLHHTTNDELPHISEEFGILHEREDQRLRQNMWSNFCGGAAGGGTGSNIKPFMTFLQKSDIPFQKMVPHNELVQGGGETAFCLAQPGRHYLVYSLAGDVSLTVTGDGFQAYRFDPVNGQNLEGPLAVEAGENIFSAETGGDWVLWVTRGDG